MKTPANLKYNKADQWVKVEADIATIGITDYAQEKLSDVVFVEIKVSVGEPLAREKTFAVVESVKASSDIAAPLSGKVLEINAEIVSSPEVINSDPYGRAWLIKVQFSKPAELGDLIDSGAYQEYRKE